MKIAYYFSTHFSGPPYYAFIYIFSSFLSHLIFSFSPLCFHLHIFFSSPRPQHSTNPRIYRIPARVVCLNLEGKHKLQLSLSPVPSTHQEGTITSFSEAKWCMLYIQQHISMKKKKKVTGPLNIKNVSYSWRKQIKQSWSF